ncbi:MAG: hypothetical protein K6C96_06690 [Butyrivibrio sp.]|nr:hypothetical protein [Butyrivibrio sp.]
MGMTGMDISEIESQLVTLESGAVKLDDLTEGVGKLQQPLQDCWEGEEADAAVNLINDISTKMTQMAVEVRKIYKWVDDVKESYVEAASKGASAYGAGN